MKSRLKRGSWKYNRSRGREAKQKSRNSAFAPRSAYGDGVESSENPSLRDWKTQPQARGGSASLGSETTPHLNDRTSKA